MSNVVVLQQHPHTLPTPAPENDYNTLFFFSAHICDEMMRRCRHSERKEEFLQVFSSLEILSFLNRQNVKEKSAPIINYRKLSQLSRLNIEKN